MTNELPGMQDKCKDCQFEFGSAICTDCDGAASSHYQPPAPGCAARQTAQEKTREDFEERFPLPAGFFWIDGKGYQCAPSASNETVEGLRRYMARWQAWQACAARSAETIAGLKANIAHLKQIIHVEQLRCDRANARAAAAQADNARLRGLLYTSITSGILGYPEANGYVIEVKELLAHPLDTSALEAYVAKKTAAKIDELPEAVIDAPRYFLQGLELGIKHCAAMREHLTRCGCEIDYLPKWFLDDSASYITKAGKAILIYAMMAHAASLPPAPDKQGEQAE